MPQNLHISLIFSIFAYRRGGVVPTQFKTHSIMNYQTFQTAVYLCKAEQSRIDELWRNEPNCDDYRLKVVVMVDTIHIYPAKNACLHNPTKFFEIAITLDANIYMNTIHRNDGAIVPRICIF